MPDLLLEIGLEEIPAAFIAPALHEMKRIFTENCAKHQIRHGTIRHFGTPRRLALQVADVEESVPPVSKRVQGPSVQASFDNQGQPKPAAVKFAESAGTSVDQLEQVQTPKGLYLAVTITQSAMQTEDLLPDILHSCISGIKFQKSMRWSDVETSFARPMHWIAALFGTKVVPLLFADVTSGRVTFGHRFMAPAAIELQEASQYEEALEAAFVIPDFQKRKEAMLKGIDEIAKGMQGTPSLDGALVDQVVNLVELPCPLLGSFEERHLELPVEVLVEEMQVHQRYFPIFDSHLCLRPNFIAISNTRVETPEFSIRGYERILKARLTDGRFFFDEDRRMPLTQWISRLERRTWFGELGTMAEKTSRIQKLGVQLAQMADRASEIPTIQRASALCKVDLETSMVGEFPELQGVMGREYAKHWGESESVALAIQEHYMPRTATDKLPTQDAGAFIGLADRLDSLCGLIAIGKRPTSTKDDFALRRAAISFIRIVTGRCYRFSLAAAIDASLELLQPRLSKLAKVLPKETVKSQLLEFIQGRAENLWRESIRHDLIDAVLSRGIDDLAATEMRLATLADSAQNPSFAEIMSTFKRISNIVSKKASHISEGPVDPALFEDPSEHRLFDKIKLLKTEVDSAILASKYSLALSHAMTLKTSVDAFFEAVMIVTDNVRLRDNRIRLLQHARSLFEPLADFSKVLSSG